MRTVGRRSVVLYILLAAFIGGFGYLCFKVFTNGSTWVTQAYNGHIYADDATAVTGDIYDRNGNLLATTVDGERVYSDDESVRYALLHTVGDSSGYIGTSVQALLRSKLMGYNIITGLNRTPFQDLGLNNMTLTVDANVCATAYNALGGKKGAVLVYNYKTGEIICKVSAPSYDPGAVPDDLTDNDDYDGVFVDNTVSSSYTPGSIFKIVTAACAIENLSDWDSRTYTCEGEVYFGDEAVTCLDYHGEINIYQAMEYSCNCYFSQLAVDLGYDKLMATAEELGFNKSLDFSNFTTADSSINLEESTKDSDIGWAGIGQYTVLVNPMQYLTVMGAIANGGSYAEPYVTNASIFDALSSDTQIMDSSTASSLKDIMRYTVENYYGDSMFPDGWEVCAKTGTAEVGEGKEPNAWICGFSSNEDYPYAFVVCVENGGSGYSVAGSVASTVLNAIAYG